MFPANRFSSINDPNLKVGIRCSRAANKDASHLAHVHASKREILRSRIKKPSILELAVAAILIYMLSNNIQSLLNYRNGLKRLEEKTQAINTLKAQNENLRAQIANTQTDEFLQKAAIDQLNLSKPGETILILDNEENASQTQSLIKPENSANTLSKQKTTGNLTLWRKAFNL